MKRKQQEISKNLLNDNQSKTVYPSMRMVRRVRHWFKKPVKAVFDAESNPDYMDSDIKEKARLSGLSVKEYDEALKQLNKSPTGLLMLTIAQLEKDFLKNWFNRMNIAIKLAESKKDYKAIVMIEKEKQITVERLIKAGRLASPFEKEREEENALNIDVSKFPLLPGEAGYRYK